MRTASDLDAMAAALEATSDFRVLRRLVPRRQFAAPGGAPTRIGLFIDLETTGLDVLKDEIIEMAMVPFTYTADGRICAVEEPFVRLRQPSIPIPAKVTELAGIDDAMVAGQHIDADEVAQFAAPAAVVVAHNAAFDRRFAEKFCDTFCTKAWACSMSQVPWSDEGFDGAKLSVLLAGYGHFHVGHRAADDCLAAIEVLSRPLPRSGQIAFARMLEIARKPTYRIWAVNSPFDLKDGLKARGYRWNDGADGRPRSWFRDVPDESLDGELDYLRHDIYQRDADIPVRKITAYDRFSDRN